MKNYLLLLSVITTFSLTGQNNICSDLFISEYVEGPGNNNAIEIYNPTSFDIDLSDYTINRYGNGSSSDPEVWQLSGTINSGDVVVVGNGQQDSVWVSTYWSLPVDAAFFALLDDHCSGDYSSNNTFYFNGDDAMTIEKNGNIIDVFGKVGEDPGAAWTDDISAGYTDANGGTWWTKRQTLIRKPSVQNGVTQNPILFDPSLEYDSLPDATYTSLGAHNCDCFGTSNISENLAKPSFVLYPNPVSKGSSVTVNSNFEIKKISLRNVIGKDLSFKNTIYTENLSSGVYILQISFLNGKSSVAKLVIE